MSKTFRPWKIDEPLLLQVTVEDFVSENARTSAFSAMRLGRDSLVFEIQRPTFGLIELGPNRFAPLRNLALA